MEIEWAQIQNSFDFNGRAVNCSHTADNKNPARIRNPGGIFYLYGQPAIALDRNPQPVLHDKHKATNRQRYTSHYGKAE
jgi:hypothetical protein